jgi:polysaccharide export outer membrane protein
MFRTEGQTFADFRQAARQAEGNYMIRKNDLLKISVFTNKGERIIDPDFELQRSNNQQGMQSRPDYEYLVNTEGLVHLPLVGNVKVEGLTLRQAEEMLQKAYSAYYTQPYVRMQCTSNRVVVLGLPQSKVVPLPYENMTLAEVIAMAGGLDRDSRADNVRIIRDDQLYVANLSTAQGYTNNNMLVQPGDIIYIEPIRRPASEALRDYFPIVSIISSLITLIVVLNAQ